MEPARLGFAQGPQTHGGRPERHVPPRAGVVRAGLRLAGLRVDRLPQRRRQYPGLRTKRQGPRPAGDHRLQLHPAYSYEDFVRGLHVSESGATEYRAGYLLNLIDDIEQQTSEIRLPHVLILDEMNRTDLSRMLGECFSLLEDRNQTIELPALTIDGTSLELRIPDDLIVIGTMNLIDQSIEQIDFALRRRFLWLLCPFDAEALVTAAESKWIELDTGVEWDRVEPDFQKLSDVAVALNKEIHDSPLLGPQYEIGHTYLLDVVFFLQKFLGPHPNRKQVYLWNKKGHALEPVLQVWNFSLRPLLEQYLAGLDATARNDELNNLADVILKPAVAA